MMDPEETAPLTGIRRALVIGLGASGLAASRLLREAAVEVTVAEAATDHPDATVARELGCEVRLGETAPDVAGFDLVVPSPGVPEHTPALQAALDGGVPVWSEPELAMRLHPRRLLAVTGTNGKTSVTELLAAMVTASGAPAVTCGNIGTPVSDAVRTAGEGAVLVAELSSFQLRFAGRLRPEVGVLLNLADDHLDWHRTADAYHRAKARLWEAQQEGDWALANLDDPVTVRLRDVHAPAGRAMFSGTAEVPGPGVGVVDGSLVADVPGHRGRILDLDELPLDAPHHHANVAAAAAAALLAGVPVDAVGDAARSFAPGRHRLELVTQAAGVRYVDDSKATNVHAAAAALGSADSIVWIAGGLGKGADLAALSSHLGPVRSALLIGEAAEELSRVCEGAGVPAERLDSIEEAVERAAAWAEPGDTVLLAPACASFDQFSGYAQRGERFAAAVHEVTSRSRACR
jgi:UDP-N-acetylmuramoylalanine--D-glutamate ligase